ncbi:DUF1569 domain-containing protein [Leptospira sp. 'Mane']|uniref:DUF1569 domain-containing protein n=1 Tax=Leptospira sp. 'Mane' TaxID=3387407 RepID=UPI00398AD15F
MKTPLKFKQLGDVENELGIILACDRKPKYDLTIFQIFDFVSAQIESSIQSATNSNHAGLFARFMGKYKFAKLLTSGSFTKANQIFGFPQKKESGDEKISETRLKTAITAFKLHSGPFGFHPVYGDLDKKQWEKFHSILAGFLFGYISLEGDEKIRFFKEKEAKREKFAQDKIESQHSKHREVKEGQNNHNPNRKWKSRKRNNYKGNKNGGKGGPK